MSDPTVLTIILNWRTPDMTLQSLEAARVAMASLPGEIIIVDNASGDGSFEQMQAACADMADVRVIQSGRNGGFGAGNNVGIRAGLSDGSKPDYVYVLNSDAFVEPTTISELRRYLEATPKAGFAGSYIIGDDGVPHVSTFRFPSVWSELEGSMRFGPVTRLLKNHKVPVDVPEKTCRVDWLAGASLMMRQSVLDEIGLFDETFFLYFEETDLCRRAFLAGHETHFVRESEVMHIGGKSTGMKEWVDTPEYWFDSRSYYFRKNHGTFGLILATKAHALGGMFHRLRALLTGKRPVDGPRFLRRLIGHDMRSMFQRLPASHQTAPKEA